MRQRVRAEKIIIDVPLSESEPWITLPIQRLVTEDDGTIVQVIPRDSQVYRKLTDVATQFIQAPDPVTGQMNTVSVAGLGALVTVAAAIFMAEDYDGTIDEEALVWINE